MTRISRTVLIDDLDGSIAFRRLSFSVGTRVYSIDLSEENRKAFFSKMEPFIRAAQGAQKSSRVDPKAVRLWAASHSIHVSPRGRIHHLVIEQYLRDPNHISQKELREQRRKVLRAPSVAVAPGDQSASSQLS